MDSKFCGPIGPLPETHNLKVLCLNFLKMSKLSSVSAHVEATKKLLRRLMSFFGLLLFFCKAGHDWSRWTWDKGCFYYVVIRISCQEIHDRSLLVAVGEKWWMGQGGWLKVLVSLLLTIAGVLGQPPLPVIGRGPWHTPGHH